MAYGYNPLNDPYDIEGGAYGRKRRSLDPSYEFAETAVRQGFVRKVFGLLALQLAVTCGITAAFLFHPNVKTYVASNPWTLWTPLIASFALVITLSCSQAARRSHPLNLIMLFAFTACEGVLVGAASATYNTNLVLMAGGITAAVVTGLALFAMQTKLDLTASGGALLSLLITLVVASIIQSFVHLSWLHLMLSAGGALLFSVYLVFDIQLLMGTGAVSVSPDEYVYAALALYLDILNLFLYILQILNEVTRNS